MQPLRILLDDIPQGQLLQPLGRDAQLAVEGAGQLAIHSAGGVIS